MAFEPNYCIYIHARLYIHKYICECTCSNETLTEWFIRVLARAQKLGWGAKRRFWRGIHLNFVQNNFMWAFFCRGRLVGGRGGLCPFVGSCRILATSIELYILDVKNHTERWRWGEERRGYRRRKQPDVGWRGRMSRRTMLMFCALPLIL